MFKIGGRLGLCTFWFLIPLYCISCHIRDNVSFKFGGVDKHTICLFVCLFACFVCFKDEASPFIYLHIFVFSLYSICRLMLCVFISIQFHDKFVIDCCLWIIKCPIFVVFRLGVHQMILSILSIKYPLWFFKGGFIEWFDKIL